MMATCSYMSVGPAPFSFVFSQLYHYPIPVKFGSRTQPSHTSRRCVGELGTREVETVGETAQTDQYSFEVLSVSARSKRRRNGGYPMLLLI